MKKWTYFTLREMIHSDTAERNNLKNLPDGAALNNLDTLVRKVLDPLREYYGEPIKVTSGYRSRKLNQLVKGVKNSQHCIGQAADLQPLKIYDWDKFLKSVVEWCKENEFDQCIIEKNGTTRWVHISYREGSNRRKIFRMVI